VRGLLNRATTMAQRPPRVAISATSIGRGGKVTSSSDSVSRRSGTHAACRCCPAMTPGAVGPLWVIFTRRWSTAVTAVGPSATESLCTCKDLPLSARSRLKGGPLGAAVRDRPVPSKPPGYAGGQQAPEQTNRIPAAGRLCLWHPDRSCAVSSLFSRTDGGARYVCVWECQLPEARLHSH